ncbi:MAG: hypothetical protein ACHQ2Z_06090 [Elusimicrobiota bacterium]
MKKRYFHVTIFSISKSYGTNERAHSYKSMGNSLSHLSDDELICSLKALVKEERGRTVAVLRHLEEMDKRRIAEETGFPSLFEYCVRELRYAHGAAA